MYETFYGLREKPFHVTADVSFLFPSRDHREAMAHLTYGIQQRLGFLMITGEVGTGKTTLAKTLLGQLHPPTRTALMLNPGLNGIQLLQAVLQDFGSWQGHTPLGESTLPKKPTRGELLRRIEEFLLEVNRLGGDAVLIIDEAQAVSSSTLEMVRLLSNVESDKAKLIQIILIGQPELIQRFSTDRRLRALNERIAVRYHIQPLQKEEVASYIQHRLRTAGASHPPPFTPEAVAIIAEISQGIPRRINHLCDRALLAGFVQEHPVIDESLVKEVLTSEPPCYSQNAIACA